MYSQLDKPLLALDKLSRREIQVLKLWMLFSRPRCAKIAQAMSINIGTVHSFNTSIREKFSVNRIEDILILLKKEGINFNDL